MSTAARETTGWVGWLGFAAIILIMNGVFSAVQGLVALVGSSAYDVVANGNLFLFDITGWGWWNLFIGLLLLFTGIALFSGATWARVVTVIITGLSAVGQIFLLPAQPWWSLIIIAIDVLVIFAITAHGREFAQSSEAV